MRRWTGTRGLGRAVNRSGAAYLTPAILDGRWMVRVSIGAPTTESARRSPLGDDAGGGGGSRPMTRAMPKMHRNPASCY